MASQDPCVRTADVARSAPALAPPPHCPLTVCASLVEGERQVAALRDEVAQERRALQALRRRARRQELLGRESDHRLLNGLQLVASLLALQARRTASAEAAAALSVAARRVATIGSLHRRLQGQDAAGTLDLADYLRSVCDELDALLAAEYCGVRIRFEGAALAAPRLVGLSLGFIAAELVTNAAKYGGGEIAVRLAAAGPHRFALSVSDQGAGFPPSYDPQANQGLGMKIIASLLRDLPGDLPWGPGGGGRGACLTVTFALDEARAPEAPAVATTS